MRSTTFAILGVTAAMCLGLVAIVSQQGLPVLPGLPLPALSVEQGKVHDAEAIATPRTSPRSDAEPAASAVQQLTSGGRARAERSDSSGLSGSHQLATVQDSPPADSGNDVNPGAETPVAPVSEAPPPDEVPASAPAPAPVPEPVAATPAVGTPPGKATAAVDASASEEEKNAQAREDETQEERGARRGQKGGRTGRSEPSPPLAVPPEPQEDTDAQEDAPDGVESSAAQAEIDEDRGRGGGRGHRRSSR
jgi:hypothetical protein